MRDNKFRTVMELPDKLPAWAYVHGGINGATIHIWCDNIECLIRGETERWQVVLNGYTLVYVDAIRRK